MTEKVTFTASDGSLEEFYCLEQTRIGNVSYLLVTDTPEGDGQAWILKDLSAPTDEQAEYVPVEDEEELEAVYGVFAQMLEDIDLEK